MSQVLVAAKAVIMNDNKFLILKQTVDNTDYWDLPGGKIKFGETPIECLEREVKEETGLEVSIKKILGVWWFFRQTDGNQVICITYLCDYKSGKIKLQKSQTEVIKNFEWVTKNDFLKYHLNNDSLKNLVNTIP